MRCDRRWGAGLVVDSLDLADAIEDVRLEGCRCNLRTGPLHHRPDHALQIMFLGAVRAVLEVVLDLHQVSVGESTVKVLVQPLDP